MLKNSFLKTIPFLLFIILLTSCDKEFSVIGEDLIGENSFNILKKEYTVLAYNQKIKPVQSNNLPTNALGVLVDPSFGTTTATFVTQLTLASINPTFATSAKIKSVVLSVPYFSTKTATNATDGSSTYVLDSIYGPEKQKIKLSIYESGVFMRDLDPEEQLTQPQKYYTNQDLDFRKQLIPNQAAPRLLNDDADKTQNAEFFFDPAEHPVKSTDGTTTYTPPAMQLNLNKDFFQDKLIGPSGAPAGKLVDNDVFKSYFKGLFFDVETIDGNPGNLAMINFKAGTITVTYTETIDGVATDKTLVLNLTGNTVSLLTKSNPNDKYENAITNPNTEKGDSNLYLKGGEGSMSVLKLFGPGELDDLRKNQYLINEADLTLYLNSAEMGASYIPRRVYLYDYTNNKILLDYNESTVVTSDSKYNKYVFGGILGKDSNGAYFYKFKITNHIRNLVKTLTAANVDLGLVVTEDINTYAFYTLRDKADPVYLPVASVMNPLGAIVFGTNIPSDNANYAKRIKFEIYYTKPN
jgi:hypothetical protein